MPTIQKVYQYDFRFWFSFEDFMVLSLIFGDQSVCDTADTYCQCWGSYSETVV